MVRVSKYTLPSKVQAQMYDQLAELFLANTRKHEFTKTLYEILSPTERIMLAKRVGIIGMLTLGDSARKISATFNVSTATVARFSEHMEQGDFPHITAIFKRKKYQQSFLGILESIVTLGGISPNPYAKLREQRSRARAAIKAGGS